MAPSSLLFFLVSSVCLALSPPLLAPAAAADVQGGEHCAPKLCGNNDNVTISFPFELVQESAPQNTTCGAANEFQVRCHDGAPHLGFYQSEHAMRILSISYHKRSLLIVDDDEIHKSEQDRGCRIPAANTSSKLVADPFSISPANQNLIFYNCTNKPPSPGGEGLVETICRENTYVRVADERSDGFDSYFLEGCNATVVPVYVRSSTKANASRYKELINNGFLLTWQLPSSSPSPSSLPSPQPSGRSDTLSSSSSPTPVLL